MVKRNSGFSNLTAGYLFPEVARRRREYLASHPDAKIISLGIGNTTEPLSNHISKAMADYALGLSTMEGYSGYGDEQGNSSLRKKIAEVFYSGMADEEEIFISDGATPNSLNEFGLTYIGLHFLSNKIKISSKFSEIVSKRIFLNSISLFLAPIFLL